MAEVLAEMLDLVWEDAAKTTNTMTWSDLVNMVLNMRGSNPATVKARGLQLAVRFAYGQQGTFREGWAFVAFVWVHFL